MEQNISIIAAVSENMAIGRDNKLLFHIGEDLQRFKILTTGHTVIMGRRTFDSLPKKPLPKRKNIVLTHDMKFHYEVPKSATGTLKVAHSMDEVLKIIKGENEVFVIGGGQIYEQFLPMVNRMYITWVYQKVKDADTNFPPIDPAVWRVDTMSPILTHENVNYSFYNYVRR